MQRRSNNKEDGFTLIEMIIVMAVFIVVIMIASHVFDTVLTRTKVVSKSEESNIEGVVGLEMFRHDLEQAGFGLFTETDIPLPTYAETATAPASDYNDSPAGIPRAVIAGDNLSPGNDIVLSGTDYLVIKATTVGRTQVSQKWTYINGLGASKIWGINDFTTADHVIAVRQNYKNGELRRKLIYNPTATNTFSVTYKAHSSGYPDPFRPPSDAIQYYYYGIDDNHPIAPFNRTDYVVKRTSGTPDNCAPGAGVLYKATMNQIGGAMTNIPILDCVADMQVVFGWNTGDPTGSDVDTYTNADMTTVATTLPWKPALNDPADIRKHLKLIKIYILAQDGGYDKNFTNPNALVDVGVAGETSLTKQLNLGNANYRNYRWKLYRIVVKPKNLL
jgi:prepilin-type N-terminal cleavage/methylation domain-containing protein